jgi:hypothetical protein
MPRNADMTVSAYVDFQLDDKTILELVAEYNQVTGMLRLSRMDCGVIQAEVGGGEVDEVFFGCFQREIEIDMRVQVRAEWVSRVTHTVEFNSKEEYDDFMRDPAAYLKSEQEYQIVEDVDTDDINDIEIIDIDVISTSDE